MINFTKEEKIAARIINLINDIMVDPRAIGYYLARIAPRTTAEKMAVVVESAKQEYDRIEQQEKLRQEANSNGLLRDPLF